jgi:hypothetical protein
MHMLASGLTPAAAGPAPRQGLTVAAVIAKAARRISRRELLAVLAGTALLLCLNSLLRGSVPQPQLFTLPPSLPSCPADEMALLQQPTAGAGRLRLLLLSTYVPTHCGLATFAHTLRRGLLDSGGVAAVDVVAIHTGPPGSPPPDYPPEARRAARRRSSRHRRA